MSEGHELDDFLHDDGGDHHFSQDEEGIRLNNKEGLDEGGEFDEVNVQASGEEDVEGQREEPEGDGEQREKEEEM
jgi:hypothetical protein